MAKRGGFNGQLLNAMWTVKKIPDICQLNKKHETIINYQLTTQHKLIVN
jgi:hypothetical protein